MDLSIPRYYQDRNLQPIPIQPGTSKAPATRSNGHWYDSPSNAQQIASAFSGDVKLGIVCGKVSGNLEVLDIEGRFERPRELLERIGEAIGMNLLQGMPIVKTPSGGFHVYYRVAENVSLTNDQFAYRMVEKDGVRRKEVLIESRGKGYVLAPCQYSNMPYRLISGSYQSIPVISEEQRKKIHEVAKGYNEVKKTTLPLRQSCTPNTFVPEEGPLTLDSLIYKYNCETDWSDILEPHGWTYAGNDYWTRPGKNHGVSASTQTESHCGNFKILTVFSSNSDLYDDSTSKDYATCDPFTAYYTLNLDGDRNEGCRFLRQYYADFWKPLKAKYEADKLKQELIDMGINPEWLK